MLDTAFWIILWRPPAVTEARDARRALDDFWGPAGADEPPFFELAATGYLQSADQVLRRHPTTQRQFDRL